MWKMRMPTLGSDTRPRSCIGMYDLRMVINSRHNVYYRALMAPGWRKEWHIGVRATKSRKLVAFISGIQVDLRVRKSVLHCSEINFLCIHKKLRSKRLAPVLIKEITRRC